MLRPISLNGKWEYITDPKDKGEQLCYFDPLFSLSNKKTMNIPSNWQVAGLDDFGGTVWFRKQFHFNEKNLKNKRIFIVFYGVDYFAKVWLNGFFVGAHEGYFQKFEFEITDFLKKDNTVVVKVTSPIEPTGKNAWPHRKTIIKGVFSHHDVRPGSWHPKFGQSRGTGGIWNDVEIKVYDYAFIKNVIITPKLNKSFSLANVLFDVDIDSNSNVVSTILLEIFDEGWRKVASKKKNVFLKKGQNKVKQFLQIKSPKLWWPWEMGKQNFYFAKVTILDAKNDGKSISSVKKRFGIREIKISENKTWFINGRRIFVRGTNIIPEEYLSTYTLDRIKKDVALIKEANCNAVRIHAHVNRKELYDTLDEEGIMVWQDFALQWEYTDDPKFISNAVSQIKDMVKMLHNNPSILVWCCHNEPVANAKKLDEELYLAVKKEDSSRAIIKSSNFNEHPYPGWFWGHYRYFLSLVGKPFPSEFGAQALPCKESLKKMFPKNRIFPPNWIEWAYRDFAYEQTFQIAQIQMGKNIDEFIKNSQNYQSELIKFAIETYRQNKWTQINGIFHFMLLEPWPAISYSVVDYFRKKKKAFYTLKKSFQPIVVVNHLQRKIFGIGRKIEGQFWLINDFHRKIKNAKIVFSIRKKGKILHGYNAFYMDIDEDSCKEITNKVYFYTKGLEIPKNLRPSPVELFAEVFDENENLISSNSEEISLVKIPKRIEKFNAEFLWE